MKPPAVEAHLVLTADGKLAAGRGSPLESFRWRPTDALLTQSRRKPSADRPLVVVVNRSTDWRKLLAALARDQGIRRFICGGEPPVLKALVEHGLLSRLHVVFAPLIAGGARTPTLLGPAATAVLARSVALELERFTSAGAHARATYRVLAAKK